LTIRHVAHWVNCSWQPLGQGLGGNVFALAVYNDDLIAGGFFSDGFLACWDGKNWKMLNPM
jgi:hypothetical protein